MTNTQKTSITLQISVEIIDIGFHAENDKKLFENINSIILVCVEKYKYSKTRIYSCNGCINKSDFKKTKRELKKNKLKK